jgi:putative acyl-CoA dehydrogenase
VNAIWEGSGNIQCLDVLRAMQKTPDVVRAFLQEMDKAKGGHAALDRWVAELRRRMGPQEESEYGARDMADRMALAIQAALLVQHAPASVADAFCLSRLDSSGRHNYGSLPRGLDCEAIIERATPRS